MATVIINGQEYQLEEQVVRYNRIVELAGLPVRRRDYNVTFVRAYTNDKSLYQFPRDGGVLAWHGTVFYVK
jgi:hypothetical protein